MISCKRMLIHTLHIAAKQHNIIEESDRERSRVPWDKSTFRTTGQSYGRLQARSRLAFFQGLVQSLPLLGLEPFLFMMALLFDGLETTVSWSPSTMGFEDFGWEEEMDGVEVAGFWVVVEVVVVTVEMVGIGTDLPLFFLRDLSLFLLLLPLSFK